MNPDCSPPAQNSLLHFAVSWEPQGWGVPESECVNFPPPRNTSLLLAGVLPQSFLGQHQQLSPGVGYSPFLPTSLTRSHRFSSQPSTRLCSSSPAGAHFDPSACNSPFDAQLTPPCFYTANLLLSTLCLNSFKAAYGSKEPFQNPD